MNRTIPISPVIWDAATASMKRKDFVIEVDVDKIKASYFHKALANKGGKSQLLNGAIIIRPIKD
jgi:hypothetical protein